MRHYQKSHLWAGWMLALATLPVALPAVSQTSTLDPSFFPHDEPPIEMPAAPVPAALRLEIDLSSRRLTLYEGETERKRYPIAVGRQGWQTPIGEWEVREMIANPAWRNPFTGAVTPGGDPENPLGNFWIGFWSDGRNWVGMHGTPNPESVGRAASHGCIRLYGHDIEELFSRVTVGTPVVVVP